MTEKLDLDELDRLLAAATPGEWMQGATSVKREALLHLGEPMSFHVRSVQLPQVDVALIVALRNAAPALLAELRALRRVAEAAKEMRLAESDWMALCSVSIPSRGDLATLRCESARKELDAALKEAGL